PPQVSAHVIEPEGGAHGHYPAADVIADAARRDHVAIGGDAADGHRVSDVVVGHEHRLAHPAVPGHGPDLRHGLKVVRVAVDANQPVVELPIRALLDDHRLAAHP